MDWEDEVMQEEQKALTVIEQANGLAVQNQAGLEAAAELGKTLKAIKVEIEATFKPVIEKAHAAHKEACAAMKKHLDPIDAALALIRGRAGDYMLAEKRRQAAEAERLQAEARAKAEAERLKQVEIALAAGKTAKAEVLIAKPVIAPRVEVAPAPKVEGMSGRENWKIEVIDKAQLPFEYLIPDMKALGAIARVRKGDTKIPGTRVWCEGSAAI